MIFESTDKGIKIKLTDKFDLGNTFECGQCFRWNKNTDGSYSGIVKGRYAVVTPEDEDILICGAAESDMNDIWTDYFDLGNDYDTIRQEISEHCPGIKCAVDSINGIRILSQEPWEALCSFIISQNNNIPRIKGIVERLCENFGEKFDGGYAFPSAEVLADAELDDLAPIRRGFRARYIIDAAKKVSSGEVDLSGMRKAPLDDCCKELMSITGVGVKVAECTLLYGLHRLDAFPVDVWMKKALGSLFCGITPAEIGQYAGIAQQYIFHYSRLHPDLVK